MQIMSSDSTTTKTDTAKKVGDVSERLYVPKSLFAAMFNEVVRK
jgi:hypothetical protein